MLLMNKTLLFLVILFSSSLLFGCSSGSDVIFIPSPSNSLVSSSNGSTIIINNTAQAGLIDTLITSNATQATQLTWLTTSNTTQATAINTKLNIINPAITGNLTLNNGFIKLNSTSLVYLACSSALVGQIRYNQTSNTLMYCNSTIWKAL